MKHRYPLRRRLPWLTALLGSLALLLALIVVSRLFGPETETPSLTVKSAVGKTLTPREEYPAGTLSADLTFDKLLLEKADHRLTAFSKGKIVRVYLVALGGAPVGYKEVQGDNKTPEGSYTINDKNPHSAYHRNLGISYPSKADRDRAKKLGKSPGGDIKIHGLAPDFAEIGPAHRLTDWTYGCIAVTNPEIEELFARTPVGTHIEIAP